MKKLLFFLLILIVPLIMAAAPSIEHFSVSLAADTMSTEEYCEWLEGDSDYALEDLPIYVINRDQLNSCSTNICDINEELSDLAAFIETDIIADCSDYLADQDTLAIYCSDKETGDLSKPGDYIDCLDVGVCSDDTSSSMADCLSRLFISGLGTSEDWDSIITDDAHSFHSNQDVAFGDDFYKEKFNDIIDSTFAFEFQANSAPDYDSTVDFAISHALSESSYCISDNKIETFFGEKYIIFLEEEEYDRLNDGSFSEVSNPINVGLKAGDSNPTRFHNIDDHLKIGGKTSSDLADLSFEEKCGLLSDLKSRRTSEGYDDGQDYTYNHYSSGGSNNFYPGFNVTGITTTTTWPWNTLQRGQSASNYPEECPEHDYTMPNGGTVEQACGTNILWSMKAYDINDVALRTWRGNTFGSKYLEMEFEYKTPSNPASVESEYEWNATNELTYSRIENNYAVEEVVVENSDSTVQTLLDSLGLSYIFAPSNNLEVWYKVNFEPKFNDTACDSVEGECIIIDQKVYFGIKDNSMVTNFNSKGDYKIKGAMNYILKTSTEYIPLMSTFDIGDIEVTDTYVEISTNLESANLAPNQDFTFTLQGISLNEKDIQSFLFDSGQREVPNGIYTITAEGDFECSETSGVVCSGHTSYYDLSIGKGKGNPCACPKSDSGSGNVYVGQKSGTNLEALFQPYFDGTNFEYEFNMNYPSKTSCGPDRVCQVVLEITDNVSVTSTREISLYLPGVQSCSVIYPNSIPGTNTSSFVGFINDGEDSCQCKNGYERNLDEDVNALSGGYAYDCTKIIVETPETNTTNTTTSDEKPKLTGKPNPTQQNQQKRNPSEHKEVFPKSSTNDSSSGLTIFLIIMLLILAGIFGFEFYRKKKTGEFFNPFRKSPTTATPSAEPATSSPIQKFISDAKTAGEETETIRQNLKNSGWPEEEINKNL